MEEERKEGKKEFRDCFSCARGHSSSHVAHITLLLMIILLCHPNLRDKATEVSPG